MRLYPPGFRQDRTSRAVQPHRIRSHARLLDLAVRAFRCEPRPGALNTCPLKDGYAPLMALERPAAPPENEQAEPIVGESQAFPAGARQQQVEPVALPGIGKIERVRLRDVWQHEALNLTTWLEENIDVLNSALDLNLTNVERERSAGAFNIDLVAEDDSGGLVVIENQLERSNHDHLGKLITYTAFMEARAAIWIVSDPRPEHVRAISWLNEGAGADFFLVKLEGIRIGDSLPAPLLTLIVGPSEETREVGEVKKERAERYSERRRFWTGLLEVAKQKTRLHSAVSPGEYTWVGAGAGKSGITYNYTVGQHRGGVELYIDRGQGAEDENLRIFTSLLERREEIEERYGGPLSWEPLEGKRACRIAERFNAGGYRDEESWNEIHATMTDAMVRLEAALRPHVSRLT